MHRKIQARLLVLLLGALLSINASALAQNQNFVIKEVGTPFINTHLPKDINIHQQTYGVAQADNGLLYFANVSGVVEFDGLRWRLDGSISDDNFTDIATGAGNRVYVVSNSEYGYLEPNPLGEMVFRSLVSKTPGEIKDKGRITNVDIIGDRVVYRTANSLIVYHIQSDSVSLFTASQRFSDPSKVNDQYYVNDYGKGLLRIEGNELKLVPQGEQFKNIFIRRILRYDENRLLILTRDNGFYLFDFKQLIKWDTEISGFLKTAKGTQGININDQYYVIGTEFGGVMIIDKSGKLIQKLDMSTGLAGNGWVTDLLIDQENTLWITQEGAISQVIINSPITSIDERHGVSTYVVNLGRHKGTTYLATNNGVLYKDADAPWQKIGDYKPFKPLRGSEERAWIFLNKGDDFFVIGNGGVDLVTENGVKNLYRGERLWAAVAMKNQDQVVVGSVAGHLHLLEKKNEEWRYMHQIEGFGQSIDFLEQTQDGDIWVSDSGTGIYKVHLNDTKDRALSIKTYGLEEGLPDVQKNRVFRHSDGLYFATASGVYTYNKEQDVFNEIERFKEHLDDDYIFRFIEVNQGNVYTSLVERGKSMLYKDGDGYRLDFNPFPRIYSHNSEAASSFGGSDLWIVSYGVKHVSTDRPKTTETDFQAHIRRVKVSNKKDSLLFAGADVLQDINLPKNENAIRFDYSATWYDQSERTEFQSYLEGSGDSWSAWTTQPSRNYTNLPHGDYTFKLRARNLYGQESAIDEYKFTIITPWYDTFWAYLLYAVLIILIVWLIVKLNERRLVREKRELEALIDERTEEIRRQKESAEESTKLIQQQADRLRELDKVKSRFFANISHELRTPLTLINAPLESLIHNGEIENETIKQTLKTAQRNGVSLLALVEEILDLGKLEAGKLKLIENPVRLHACLSDILSNYNAGFEKRELKLSFDFQPKKELTILLDEQKFGKVVRNLLSNALKFTEKHVLVSVSPHPNDLNRILLKVKDDGEGIHPNDLPFIFDRYYQSEEPGKKAEGGTGIGLALAKELALLQEGSLRVISEYGQGSEFIFELPINEVTEDTLVPLTTLDSENLETVLRETVTRYNEHFQVDKPVLLITEDHPEMRAFIAQTLNPYFEIKQAENGQVAFNTLKSCSIDIVISDVMMPVMDGFELLEAIKQDETLHKVSLIMLTARTEPEDKLYALTLGIDDYLTKPFSAMEFLARIKNILENRIKILREFGNTQSPDELNNTAELIRKYDLSEREVEVMQLLVKRLTNAQIGERLFISTNTVKFHIKNLFSKLDVASRSEVFEKMEA